MNIQTAKTSSLWLFFLQIQEIYKFNKLYMQSIVAYLQRTWYTKFAK